MYSRWNNYFRACKDGDKDEVVSMIRAGVKTCHYHKKSGDTALHICARYGTEKHQAIDGYLISRGADCNIENKYFNSTPLSTALECQNFTIADLFISKGSSFKLSDGNTMLQKHLEPRKCVENIWRPGVLLETRYVSSDIVQYLIDKGAPDYRKSDGKNAVWDVISHSIDPNILKLLLKAGFNCNLKITLEGQSYTPLQVLLKGKTNTSFVTDYVSLLIDNGASDYKDSDGRNSVWDVVIHHSGKKLTDLLAILLQKGFNCNEKGSINDISSPLLELLLRPLVCSQSKNEASLLLLNHGALDCTDHCGGTLMHHISYCSAEVITKAIDKEFNVHAIDNFGRNILQIMLTNTRLTEGEIIQFVHQLADKKFDFTNADSGETLLIQVVRNKRQFYFLIKDILQLAVNVNIQSNSGVTALLMACCINEEVFARSLILNGADAQISDSAGMTCLMYSVLNNNKRMTKMVLECGCDINKVCKIDGHVVSALYLSALLRHDQIYKLLLNWGADVNEKCMTGNTLLHLLVSRQDYASIKEIETSVSDFNVQNYHGKTALHIACERTRMKEYNIQKFYISTSPTGIYFQILEKEAKDQCPNDERIIQILLSKHPDIFLRDKSNRTALSYSIMCCEIEPVIALSTYEQLLDPKTQTGTQILQDLLQYGDKNIVSYMFSNVYPVFKSCDDRMLRFVMIFSKAMEVKRSFPYWTFKLQTLLEFGIHANYSDEIGQCLIHKVIPSFHGDEEKSHMVATLINFDCTVNKADDNGFTPLLLACREKLFKVVSVLLHSGASMYCKDNQHFGPVHHLCLDIEGSRKVEHTEIYNDFNIRYCNDFNIFWKVLSVFLQLKPTINAKDVMGKIALHYILDQNLKSSTNNLCGIHLFAKALMKAGSDVNMQDTSGLRPFDVLAKWQPKEGVWFEIFSLMLDCGLEQFEIKSNTFCPVIITATKQEQNDVVRKLIARKCDVNALNPMDDTSSNGPSSALHWAMVKNQQFIHDLLRAGANVNQLTLCKKTILHYMYETWQLTSPNQAHINMLICLLSAGMDVEFFNKSSFTSKLLINRHRYKYSLLLFRMLCELGCIINTTCLQEAHELSDLDAKIIELCNNEATVKSLETLAANVIRKSLYPNVWYALQFIPLPKPLKDLITFEDTETFPVLTNNIHNQCYQPQPEIGYRNYYHPSSDSPQSYHYHSPSEDWNYDCDDLYY